MEKIAMGSIYMTVKSVSQTTLKKQEQISICWNAKSQVNRYQKLVRFST